MTALLQSGPVFWYWWVLGLVLLAFEVLTPGTFFLWIGAAAFVTGVIAWLLPGLGAPAEIVIFAVLAIAAVGLWFRFKPLGREDRDTGLNERGRGYLGRELTLETDIVNGIGQARLEDTVWRVAGPPLPAGAQVRVIGADGATLRIEAIAGEPARRDH